MYGVAGLIALIGLAVAIGTAVENAKGEEVATVPEPVKECFEKSGNDFWTCQSRILEELTKFRADPGHLTPLVDGLQSRGLTRVIKLEPSEDLFSKARHEGFKTLLQTEVSALSVAVTKECSACVQAAVLARLWDVRTGTLLYEKTLLRRCNEATTLLSALPRAHLPFGTYDESHVHDDRVEFRTIESACKFEQADFVKARDAAAAMILNDFLSGVQTPLAHPQ